VTQTAGTGHPCPGPEPSSWGISRPRLVTHWPWGDGHYRTATNTEWQPLCAFLLIITRGLITSVARLQLKTRLASIVSNVY
jgi:hypothetical protein